MASVRIYFTKTHVADLKAIIKADEDNAELTGDEAIDDIESEILPVPET